MEDHFEMMNSYPISKAATAQMGNKLPENFAWYDFEVTEGGVYVRGQVFREAKSGPRKGQRVIPVKGTGMSVFVSAMYVAKHSVKLPDPAKAVKPKKLPGHSKFDRGVLFAVARAYETGFSITDCEELLGSCDLRTANVSKLDVYDQMRLFSLNNKSSELTLTGFDVKGVLKLMKQNGE